MKLSFCSIFTMLWVWPCLHRSLRPPGPYGCGSCAALEPGPTRAGLLGAVARRCMKGWRRTQGSRGSQGSGGSAPWARPLRRAKVTDRGGCCQVLKWLEVGLWVKFCESTWEKWKDMFNCHWFFIAAPHFHYTFCELSSFPARAKLGKRRFALWRTLKTNGWLVGIPKWGTMTMLESLLIQLGSTTTHWLDSIPTVDGYPNAPNTLWEGV